MPSPAKAAVLHRMVMPGHTCPFGLKAKHLLQSRGFTVDDRWLTTRAETDAFKAEHGVSYSAWRRRRLRETDPQTAASTPQTAAPARNTGENGQAAADNSIRSVSAASAEPHRSGRRL